MYTSPPEHRCWLQPDRLTDVNAKRTPLYQRSAAGAGRRGRKAAAAMPLIAPFTACSTDSYNNVAH
jgi:hypothetical protein